MFNWLKEILVKGSVKYSFIAFDDSVPEDDIKPYEDFATMEYEGEYNDFLMKNKLRKFVRLTKNHLVVEILLVERTENGVIVEKA